MRTFVDGMLFLLCAGGVYAECLLHMEHVSVDVAHNPETVDVLSASGHRQQQQRQFSLISPVSELTLSQAYVAVGPPTGISVNSADESFRIAGNGVWSVCTLRSNRLS